MKLLFDLRPALAGRSGIPQEARLLFAGLAGLPGLEVDGLLQASTTTLPAAGDASPAQAASQVLLALRSAAQATRSQRLAAVALATARALKASRGSEPAPLARLDPGGNERTLWETLFAPTLPATDFDTVTRLRYRSLQTPWAAAHIAGVLGSAAGAARYRTLDTRGYAVMVAETPYPGRVSAGTRLVVRYHDAVPLDMPHTLRRRSYDRWAHRQALRRNVDDGAWFACVSEATRQALLAHFPQLECRAVTIHNLVSPAFRRADDSPCEIPAILRRRANPAVTALAAPTGSATAVEACCGVPDYLLMVSTLEPRKNHLTLLRAWEALRATRPGLLLVLVGALGWRHESLVRRLLPWIARGRLHLLRDVEPDELRVLYRHAAATVCPSWGEGFGYPGVEALLSGGALVASDLAVHREIYRDAARYFDPRSSDELQAAVEHVLAAREAGAAGATPPPPGAMPAIACRRHLLAQWQAWLATVVGRRV